jgi:hypothetical protein
VPKIENEILKQIDAVTNKRARFVLDAIVKNGVVTTEEISLAGYEHPPRAARDVRELGFPLKTIRVKHTNGRTIAGYILPPEGKFEKGKGGRHALTKKLRDEIIKVLGAKCRICGSIQNLQADHRIPYQVAGESLSKEKDPYQLLCGSCNRKKSWACEHCQNWMKDRKVAVCGSCYWAGPIDYTHVALQQERRVDIVWEGDEISDYRKLEDAAKRENSTLEQQIKRILRG